MRLIRELWAYRGFISSSVKREFESKYQEIRSFGLRGTWINPLATILFILWIFGLKSCVQAPGVDNTFGYSIFFAPAFSPGVVLRDHEAGRKRCSIEHAESFAELRFRASATTPWWLLMLCLKFYHYFFRCSPFSVNQRAVFLVAYLALFPLLVLLVAFFRSRLGLGMVLGVLQSVFFPDVGQEAFGITSTHCHVSGSG